MPRPDPERLLRVPSRQPSNADRRAQEAFPATDLEHAAEEVQHVRKRLDSLHRNGLAKIFRCFRIELREPEIEPAQRRIGKERVDKLALLLLGGEPIVRRIEDGDNGGLIVD